LIVVAVVGIKFPYDFADFIGVATVNVTAPEINLWAGPSRSTEQLVKGIKQGTSLIATGEAENGWLPVYYSGKSGYVDAQYVVRAAR
jgi:uncharacterized protein YgiM (DUF1202 family)